MTQIVDGWDGGTSWGEEEWLVRVQDEVAEYQEAIGYSPERRDADLHSSNGTNEKHCL